jgi:hypothetical protein
VAFWGDFAERVGEIGRDPAGFYSFEIGHILHVLPDEVGELTPADILGALMMFDSQYREG